MTLAKGRRDLWLATFHARRATRSDPMGALSVDSRRSGLKLTIVSGLKNAHRCASGKLAASFFRGVVIDMRRLTRHTLAPMNFFAGRHEKQILPRESPRKD